MNIWPLRFQPLKNGAYVYSNETGASFIAGEAFLNRYVANQLSPADRSFLLTVGCAYETTNDFYYTTGLQRYAARQDYRDRTSYLILVPTLRCNLSCSYCQVSRAHEFATGFDWNDETLAAVLAYIGQLETSRLKVEFQGGEPLLRPDLLERVRTFCQDRFAQVEFVVCTNLQRLDKSALAFLDHSDVHISTSLDGDAATHRKNRTETLTGTRQFFDNLKMTLDRYGPSKVSALPTIDFSNPPDLLSLLEAYEELGFNSIYLRPVHYHGFARKSHAYAKSSFDKWRQLYLGFLDLLVERNHRSSNKLEEFYFSTCLKRVLRPGMDGHVDLRNPNIYASDYIVIDYDGKLYPSDEARMLARIGQIDLSGGSVHSGLEKRTIANLNWHSINTFNEDCVHCAYQPYCGIDVIDDIARYGRIDVPKSGTWFCQQQMMIFDRIFEYLSCDDEKVKRSLAHWAGLAYWSDDIMPKHHDTAAA